MLHRATDQSQEPQQAPAGQQPRLRPLESFAGSLGNKVYGALREAILSLVYKPGEILRKNEICEALGVSRSPVVDAVARLATEGLVQVVPQAGTFVSRFSMSEIREGAFIREAIELHAIGRVAGNITEEQLTLLRRNLTVQAALVEAGDTPGFYALDSEMHRLLLSFTGFAKLAAVSDTAWVHVDRARQLILPVPGRVQATLEEHRAILRALEDRNPVAAREAVRHHLGQLLTYLEPLERERPDLFDNG